MLIAVAFACLPVLPVPFCVKSSRRSRLACLLGGVHAAPSCQGAHMIRQPVPKLIRSRPLPGRAAACHAAAGRTGAVMLILLPVNGSLQRRVIVCYAGSRMVTPAAAQVVAVHPIAARREPIKDVKTGNCGNAVVAAGP